MTIPVIHSLVAKDGMYIVMPAPKAGQTGWGNMAHPEVYEEEAIAQYPIATKFVDGDRTWHYVQAGNSIARGRVLHSYNAYGTPTSGDGTTRETNTIAEACVIDATLIKCTDTGSAVTANVFAGGYAMVYWEFLCLRIVSNTAEDDPTADQFTITIDRPLPVAIADSSNVSIYRNKYADVRYHNVGAHLGFGSSVCVANYTKTDTRYFWGQTWGPCGLAGVDAIGASIGERAIVSDDGGSALVSLSDVTTKSYQHVGYLIPYTGPSTNGQDQPGAYIHVQLELEK